MLGDKLPEEIEFEQEEGKVAQLSNILDWATTLNKIAQMDRSFYLIGNNPKLKINICRKFKNKNEAYKLIKNLKLTSYIFAENVFETFNIGE